MLNNSLADLGKSFEVNTLKYKFPSKFAIKDHLFYEGNMPSISYYNDISLMDYNYMYMNYWSFKEETIKYLNNDLYSLHEILIKANKQVLFDYRAQITDHITISGLAVKVFLTGFYKHNIPNINKPGVYKDIKQAYYGGITEVYKPSGSNLFYYDVNSLYPYVALQDMPGLECSNMLFYTDDQKIGNLFGFFFCTVQTPLNGYLGLLPVRDPSGLTFPLGRWTGWYFSEELKFAEANGYIINVHRGYSFNKEPRVFDKYVNKIYSIKSDPINKTQKSIAKSLLNNLLGRFGINLEKSTTKVLTNKRFESISHVYKIGSVIDISTNKKIVSYIPKIDYDVVDSHGLDFMKVVNKYDDLEIQPLNIASVPISAAVTAYSRIHMHQLKMNILKHSGELYYSDTDSIVTNLKLPDTMVSSSELGKLKLEHIVKIGIFISGKTYLLLDINDEIHKKAKGVKSSSLSYNDFLDLLNGIDVPTAIRSESILDWNKGQVIIKDTKMTIYNDCYTKREKIYDDNNKWVDTKPLYNNYLDKDLVVLEKKKI